MVRKIKENRENKKGKDSMPIGAAYIRVSTEEQIEFSPDSQIKRIQEYANRNHIILPEKFIFLDEGISGRHVKNRPAFLEMISMAKAKPKPFDIILVWKFSRFARNRQDSILYKSMLRKECGINVVSITEQLSDDPTAILIEALLEAMDEYYSINLSQEVKRGMNEKFSRGGVVSIPPFGYKMGKLHFEIDEKTAPFVRMMFEDFLNGFSYRHIANKLNHMGLRSNRGNLFENRTVEYILSNPVYIGKLRRNLNGADKTDRFYRGEDITIVNGNHKPILSEAIFSKVQERINQINQSNHKKVYKGSTNFMLHGLVRCSSCGSTLTQLVKGKSLQCHKYTKGQCDKSHYVLLERLNQMVLTKIKEDLGEKKINIIIEAKKETFTKDMLDNLINKEYKKLERIKDAYKSEIDTLEEYKQEKIKITNHIKELKQQVVVLDNKQEQALKKVDITINEIIEGLKSEKLTEDVKNEMLCSFISKIIFHSSDRSIQIYYYI